MQWSYKFNAKLPTLCKPFCIPCLPQVVAPPTLNRILTPSRPRMHLDLAVRSSGQSYYLEFLPSLVPWPWFSFFPLPVLSQESERSRDGWQITEKELNSNIINIKLFSNIIPKFSNPKLAGVLNPKQIKVTVYITVDRWSDTMPYCMASIRSRVYVKKAPEYVEEVFQHIRERMGAIQWGIVSDHWS